MFPPLSILLVVAKTALESFLELFTERYASVAGAAVDSISQIPVEVRISSLPVPELPEKAADV